MNDHTPSPYFPANLEDYAPWVAESGLLYPYGICQCGCGQSTDLAKRTGPAEHSLKGHPLRYKSGHSLQAPWYESLEDYFWNHCTPGPFTECWEWQGPISSTGYGAIYYGGRQRSAHRVSWEIHNSRPFPRYKVGCHSCDNRPCVNPYHIWPGTRADNNADMVQKSRQARGETNHKAKLTELQVLEIRHLWDAGHAVANVAAQFGVSVSTVRAVGSRQTWRHLP